MDNPKVAYRRGGRYGGGLYALERINRGEIIASFDGDFYEWIGSTLDLPNDPPQFTRDHALQYGPGKSRDSNGFARFANHSCNPNCGIQNLFDIVAMVDILRDEEISWDYAMSEDNDWVMHCLCRAPSCRRLIRGYSYLPEDRRKAYTGFISEWLTTSHRPFLGTPVDPPTTSALPPAAALLGHQIL